MQDRRETAEPKCVKLITETLFEVLATALTLNEDPIDVKPIKDNANTEPISWIPLTERPEPNLLYCLKDNELPMFEKFNTEISP